MTDDEIWTAVAGAVKEETDNAGLTLRPDMTASDVPGWDSLAHTRIFLNLDVNLGITIDIKKTYAAATISDLIPIIRAALDGKAQP